MWYLLLGTANAQTHNLTVVIAADNLWTLNMPSGSSFIPITGPLDGTGTNYAWKNINTYTQKVNGNGPWLVTVQTYNEGNIAGFFAAVYLDGQPYTATGIPGSLWKGTLGECDPKWATLGYNDTAWQYATQGCVNEENVWGAAFMNQLWKATPGMATRAVWLPDCTVANAYPNNQWRLTVQPGVVFNSKVNNAVNDQLYAAYASSVAAGNPSVSASVTSSSLSISSAAASLSVSNAANLVSKTTSSSAPASQTAYTSKPNSWCLSNDNSGIQPWQLLSGPLYELDNHPWPAYSGNFSMDLCANVAYTIGQYVNLVVGQSYTLTFMLNENYCGAQTKTGFVTASGNPSQTFTHDSSVDGHNWKKVTYNFTATTQKTLVSIGATNSGSCGPVIDLVTLVPVSSGVTMNDDINKQVLSTNSISTPIIQSTYQASTTSYLSASNAKSITNFQYVSGSSSSPSASAKSQSESLAKTTATSSSDATATTDKDSKKDASTTEESKDGKAKVTSDATVTTDKDSKKDASTTEESKDGKAQATSMTTVTTDKDSKKDASTTEESKDGKAQATSDATVTTTSSQSKSLYESPTSSAFAATITYNPFVGVNKLGQKCRKRT
ncbi:hypothetical protein HDV04_005539 [Boothiomyces sp. JEL0838]|nr:hypothetical protein HDV04_005539 [Boothiomyces sp. JEL0838]